MIDQKYLHPGQVLVMKCMKEVPCNLWYVSLETLERVIIYSACTTWDLYKFLKDYELPEMCFLLSLPGFRKFAFYAWGWNQEAIMCSASAFYKRRLARFPAS